MQFELATPRDDEELRALVRDAPMDGPIRLAFEREPSYFAAERLGCEDSHVIVARELPGGEILATASRGIRRVYMNGEERRVGYLSNLRIRSEVRGRTILARGFRFLRDLHDGDGKVPWYFTTILEGNDPAQVLLGGRAGLPEYVPMGRCFTFLLPFRRRARGTPEGVEFGPASGIPRELLRAHPLAPVVEDEELARGSSAWRGLSPGEILGAFRARRMVAAMGVWDLSDVKQVVAKGYSGRLALAQRILRAFGSRLLPNAGDPFPIVYSVFSACAPGEEDAWSGLLRDTLSRPGWRGKWMALCLHENDSRLRIAAQLATRSLTSHLYLVHWEPKCPADLREGGVPHLEVGTL